MEGEGIKMDTETQIVAKLAQNIPRETPEPTKESNTPTTPEAPALSAFETNIELNDPAISLQIADFFDISKTDRMSEERQRQLRNIYRFAAEKVGSTEKSRVLNYLSLLENELGTTFKPGRLDHISKFVKLKQQSESIQRELEAYGG